MDVDKAKEAKQWQEQKDAFMRMGNLSLFGLILKGARNE